MQQITHNNLSEISSVTKGVEKYRKNTKIRPVNGTTFGKKSKSSDKISVSGNFKKQ